MPFINNLLLFKYNCYYIRILKKIKKKKKPSKKKEKTDKPAKKKAGINREQILYALEKLPPILGRALQRTGRSIRVRPLKVYVLVAGRDPADTALLYGQLEAALHGALPLLETFPSGRRM